MEDWTLDISYLAWLHLLNASTTKDHTYLFQASGITPPPNSSFSDPTSHTLTGFPQAQVQQQSKSQYSCELTTQSFIRFLKNHKLRWIPYNVVLDSQTEIIWKLCCQALSLPLQKVHWAFDKTVSHFWKNTPVLLKSNSIHKVLVRINEIDHRDSPLTLHRSRPTINKSGRRHHSNFHIWITFSDWH